LPDDGPKGLRTGDETEGQWVCASRERRRTFLGARRDVTKAVTQNVSLGGDKVSYNHLEDLSGFEGQKRRHVK